MIGAIVERVLARRDGLYGSGAADCCARQGRSETAWVTVCSNPVFDEDGKVAGIFGAMTAVSSDARTEQQGARERGEVPPDRR